MAFARTQFKRLVPLQIQALRRQRGWSQAVLAEKSRLTQGVISRAEDQSYGNLTVNTILTIAEGFDVAFVGRFVPFSELDKWYLNLSPETMDAPSFDAENAVLIAAEGQPDALKLIEGEDLLEVAPRFGNLIAFPKVEREMRGKGQLVESRAMPQKIQTEGGLANAACGNSTR